MRRTPPWWRSRPKLDTWFWASLSLCSLLNLLVMLVRGREGSTSSSPAAALLARGLVGPQEQGGGCGESGGSSSGQHVVELAEACGTLASCVSIHVFAYRREEAIQRLLEQLRAANYSGYGNPLPLVVHLDRPGGARREDHPDAWVQNDRVEELVRAFDWPHGPKILDAKAANTGLKNSWLTAWPEPRPNDVMMAFEDDVIVSPQYFQWLLRVLHEYNLGDAEARDPSLLGVSLSPVLVDEISERPRQWRPHEEWAPDAHPLYLSGIPSSWGAVYFGDRWREFLAFARIRRSFPFYRETDENVKLWGARQGDPNLWLPDSKTSCWARSWKRFMVDFAYGRGAYLLYLNLKASHGLATSTFLVGEHFDSSPGKNPRQASLAEDGELRLDMPLPSYHDLPLADVYSAPIGKLAYAARGDAFVRRIRALGPTYAGLAGAWARPCCAAAAACKAALDLDLDLGLDHHQTQQRQRSDELQQHLLTALPNQAGMGSQLTSIVAAVVSASHLNRTALLLKLWDPRTTMATADLSLEDGVPFFHLFDPDTQELAALLPGLQLAYGDDMFLRSLHPPQHLLAFGPVSSFARAHASCLGWSDAATVQLSKGQQGFMVRPEGMYAALGTCAVATVALAGEGSHDLLATRVPNRAALATLARALLRPVVGLRHVLETLKAKLLVKDKDDHTCIHVQEATAKDALKRYLAKHCKDRAAKCLLWWADGVPLGAAAAAADLEDVVVTREAMLEPAYEVLHYSFPRVSTSLLHIVVDVAGQMLCAYAKTVVVVGAGAGGGKGAGTVQGTTAWWIRESSEVVVASEVVT